jgi:hypothetical protein
MCIPRALGRGSLCALLVVTCVAAHGEEAGDVPVQGGTADGLGMPSPFASRAARKAIEGARKRLANPACRSVLTDFSDASGRRLDAVLAGNGETAQGQLDLLLFHDGSDEPRCRNAAVMAYTTPGSRDIFLCGRQFTQEQRRRPIDAEAIVIHEMLHSLGLGENPPTAAEITSRVLWRCARHMLDLGPLKY